MTKRFVLVEKYTNRFLAWSDDTTADRDILFWRLRGFYAVIQKDVRGCY